MRVLTAVVAVILVAGCATASAPPPGAQRFTGDVWTWDTETSIVTIMQDGGQAIRVKVPPETLRTLRHHQYTTVVGVPAPPSDVVSVTKPSGPVSAVPKGQPETVEIAGTVTALDPGGRLALQSERGPLHVWVAAGADSRFPRGAPVRVRMTVQPVDMVPATTAPAPGSAADAASPSSEPGDHAVVTGRIAGINPGGVLIVESPTGPLQVLTTNTARFKVGEWIQVRTSVRTTS